MNNRYGLDASYFSSKMSRIIRDIGSYKPDEFARECARMSRTADESVMREQEFAPTPSTPGTGSDALDCILGVGGFASFGPLDAQPAAHLTIPGALEWDGDNGTHGVVGTHSADGESLANHSGDTNEKAAPVAFIVGNRYATQAGEIVRFVRVHNEGTSYETMEDEQGINRYTRRDFGRCTGSAHDYSDPRNTPPLYAEPPVQYTAVDMTTAAAGGFRDGLAAFSEDGKRNVLAEVFFQQGDEPFICAVRGRICVEQLEAAQRDFRENLPKELEQGDGIYTFDFYFEEGQYGEYGMCEIAPGWGFDFVSYAAFEAADEPKVEPEAFDDIPDFTPGSGNKAKRRIAAMEKAKGGGDE